MTDSIAMLAEHHVRKGRALVSWQSMLVEDLARRQDSAMLFSAHALLVQLRIALNAMEARARYLTPDPAQMS
jgi:hypothetical protein